MSDQQAELLPCPFCGGDELAHGWSSPGMDGSMHTGSVECHSCNAMVYAGAEAEAIAAWNRRATPKSSEGALLDEAVEVLKQASTAINAAHQQTDAEWRDYMKAADRHDKTVRAFREQVHAVLSKARKAQS